ncbi:MAG: hypothetical protein H7Z40_01545 [Phycisphaerae bacterium]|nr:hypothetical protein [Gemmatimonadaceae bacterium]
MNDLRLATAGRMVALLIALFSVIDPAITSERPSRADVTVLASSTADTALARQVVKQLANDFTVLRAPFPGSAATVIVGTTVPHGADKIDGTTFGVLPDTAASQVFLRQVRAPLRTNVDARVSVVPVLEARGAQGKQIELTLLADGNIIDRVTRTAQSDTEHMQVPLTFVPTTPGAVTLRVQVQLSGAAARVNSDVMIEVREQKWAVLFFDARPSWMSTFVRRAVERDPRFAVTSRVVTSSSISTDAGKPPATLYDPALMELYDAIVVGAPESVSERDVAGLERFLRQRGGSVVLLFDGNRRGAYERLAPIGVFTNTSNSQGTVIAGATTDSVALRATEWMWPVQLPPDAGVLAMSDANASAATTRRPLVWTTSAGAGQVTVSGALDSWKFRDVAQSGFEKFWQQTIAGAAQASADAIEIRSPSTPVLPGARVAVQLTSRVAALAGGARSTAIRSTAALRLETAAGTSMVRVWPTAVPGEFAGTFNAPAESGIYRLSASADGAAATVPFVVSAEAERGNAFEPDILAGWVAGHGGTVIPASRLNELPALIQGAVTPVNRRAVWHPMRSAWWLVPFALLLAMEWWMRRRRGKA